MSMSFNFDFDIKMGKMKVDDYLRGPQGEVWRWLERKKTLALAGARAMAGVRTGRLRRSISWYHLKNFSGQYAGLRANAPYAYLHHEGTRRHAIRPNRAKALRFSQRGVIVYRSSVMHPGTKPNPYLRAQLVHFRRL
jgi:hypothetical protein